MQAANPAELRGTLPLTSFSLPRRLAFTQLDGICSTQLLADRAPLLRHALARLNQSSHLLIKSKYLTYGVPRLCIIFALRISLGDAYSEGNGAA